MTLYLRYNETDLELPKTIGDHGEGFPPEPLVIEVYTDEAHVYTKEQHAIMLAHLDDDDFEEPDPVASYSADGV